MRKRHWKQITTAILAAGAALSLTACGGPKVELNDGTFKPMEESELQFPQPEGTTLTGLISYPANTEADPNNRTIFKRLEEKTNLHIEWNAIPNNQWGEKIQTIMADPGSLTDFIFTAGFGENDLLRFAEQKVIIPLEEYIDAYMPNLKAVFDKYPEYRKMTTAADGHIYSLPWIEQLGANKTAIQTVGNMSFINKKWLDDLGLEVPETVEEFEAALIAFRDNAAKLQADFGIEGDIIPMSCIVNDGDQDPSILFNSFGEGYGDPDRARHIAVTNDKEVVFTAAMEGFKEGIKWLHSLAEQGLIDPECYTHEWSQYVAKGKAHRYGVCFSYTTLFRSGMWPTLTIWRTLFPCRLWRRTDRGLSRPRTVPLPAAMTGDAVWSLRQRSSPHWSAPGLTRCTIPSSRRRTTGEPTGKRMNLISLNWERMPQARICSSTLHWEMHRLWKCGRRSA